MSERHVVLGGFGFIGRHVTKALLARGDEVVVVDVAFCPIDWNGPAPQHRSVDLSSASDEEFDAMIAGAEVVHHYAWSTIPQTADVDPVGDLHINVGGTVRLLEALKRHGGQRMIFASSGGTVYGRSKMSPIPEVHPLAPIAAYGVSKLSAEAYVRYYRENHGLDARIARIANPFGAGQSTSRPQGVLTTIVQRALNRQAVEIWGNGEVVRDFIHIADVVAGLNAITDASAVSDALPVFNVGSGKGSSVRTILAVVEERLGYRIDLVQKPRRSFDVPSNVLDIVKIGNELGWRPKLDLIEGVDWMISDLVADPSRIFSTLDRSAGN